MWAVRTVFLIVLENHNWRGIEGDGLCPYINGRMLPQASYATRYFTPPGLHPSEPNYLWLEAGTNFGITDDESTHRLRTSKHLVTQLDRAGISWRSYQEGIDGTGCPQTDRGAYLAHHNPMVFFEDVYGSPDACRSHVRPFSELAGDLEHNTVARYNFITPDEFHDMHSLATDSLSRRVQGDAWLAAEVPRILASAAFRDDGALFVTWDEGDNSTSDGPIGLVLLSPRGREGLRNDAQACRAHSSGVVSSHHRALLIRRRKHPTCHAYSRNGLSRFGDFRARLAAGGCRILHAVCKRDTGATPFTARTE